MGFTSGTDISREQGIAAAGELAELFDAGGWPPALALPMRLHPDECCYAQTSATMRQFVEGDGTYLHKTCFGLSAGGLALGAATMMGNQVRKRRAAREATAQWRFTGQGMIYVTDQRLAISEGQTWNDVWYQDVMTATCDGSSIELQRTGLPSLRLTIPHVHYYFVLLYRLAFGQVIRPPAGG